MLMRNCVSGSVCVCDNDDDDDDDCLLTEVTW